MDSNGKDSDFRNRLAKIIGDQDPYPWAESLGIMKSTFAGPWTKGAIPQTKTLLKIARNTDISLNWLLTGQGPERICLCHTKKSEPQKPEQMDTYGAKGSEPREYVFYNTKQTGSGQEGNLRQTGDTRQTRDERQAGTPVEDMGEHYRVPQEEYVLVPRYGLRVTDGQLLQNEQVVDYLSFKVYWIKQTMGLDPRQLALISVCGDSMEPTLKEGDLLLLDRRGFSVPGRVSSDAIYVLLRGEALVVKRLQCGFDGSITIQSDNPVYATQVLPAEKITHLKIIGRVVWVGQRI